MHDAESGILFPLFALNYSVFSCLPLTTDKAFVHPARVENWKKKYSHMRESQTG